MSGNHSAADTGLGLQSKSYLHMISQVSATEDTALSRKKNQIQSLWVKGMKVLKMWILWRIETNKWLEKLHIEKMKFKK